MQDPIMAGLVPAIHVFGASQREDVDARHKTGHDASMIKMGVEASLRPPYCFHKCENCVATTPS
jgi:hypothetical protein